MTECLPNYRSWRGNRDSWGQAVHGRSNGTHCRVSAQRCSSQRDCGWHSGRGFGDLALPGRRSACVQRAHLRPRNQISLFGLLIVYFCLLRLLVRRVWLVWLLIATGRCSLIHTTSPPVKVCNPAVEKRVGRCRLTIRHPKSLSTAENGEGAVPEAKQLCQLADPTS